MYFPIDIEHISTYLCVLYKVNTLECVFLVQYCPLVMEPELCFVNNNILDGPASPHHWLWFLCSGFRSDVKILHCRSSLSI